MTGVQTCALPIFIGAIIITSALANFTLVYYSALKKALVYAKIQIIQILLISVLSIIFIYIGLSIRGLLFAKLIASLCTITIFLISEKKHIRLSIVSRKLLKKILIYAVPLMLQTTIGIIMMYYGRLLLEHFTSLETFAIYSFFMLLTIQVNQLWSYFNKAWTPKIFSDLESNKNNDGNSVKNNITTAAFIFSFLYLIGIAILIILGKLFLFKLVFKDIYLTHLNILYILLIPPLFSGISIITYPLYYYKNKTHKILYTSLYVIVLNIILTFFLVKYFNEVGAAVSTFIIACFNLLFFIFTYKKLMQIPRQLIGWSITITLVMALNISLLILTNSYVLFTLITLAGAYLAFLKGKLSQKKYLLTLLIKSIPFPNKAS